MNAVNHWVCMTRNNFDQHYYLHQSSSDAMSRIKAEMHSIKSYLLQYNVYYSPTSLLLTKIEKGYIIEQNVLSNKSIPTRMEIIVL